MSNKTIDAELLKKNISDRFEEKFKFAKSIKDALLKNLFEIIDSQNETRRVSMFEYDYDRDSYRCSVCNKFTCDFVDLEDIANNGKCVEVRTLSPNYCKNCGSKMLGTKYSYGGKDGKHKKCM